MWRLPTNLDLNRLSGRWELDTKNLRRTSSKPIGTSLQKHPLRRIMRLEQMDHPRMSVKEMSTSEIDSILTKVERLSTDDKKLLIKRVVDLLGSTGRRPKTQRTLHAGRRRKTSVRPSQERSPLDDEIAAYAQRHGGGSDYLDLDPALEAASLEHWLDEDNVL